MNLCHRFCVKHINDNLCCLSQFIVSLSILHFLNKNNVLLIYRSNKISRFRRENITNCLKCIIISVILCLDNKYTSSYIRFNMELFRPVININQK